MNTFTVGAAVQIPPGSWIHKASWVGADETATGTVVKVYKNGKVSVRIDQKRNKLKLGCSTTFAQKMVCKFPQSDLIGK